MDAFRRAVGPLELRGDTAVALLVVYFIFHIIAITKKEKNLLSVNLCFQFIQASEEKEKKVSEKEILKGLKGI